MIDAVVQVGSEMAVARVSESATRRRKDNWMRGCGGLRLRLFHPTNFLTVRFPLASGKALSCPVTAGREAVMSMEQF